MSRTPARMAVPRGRSSRAAAQAASYHAVCLIGLVPRDGDTVIPRHMGDNRGTMPVRIVACKKERLAAQKYDLGQPIHRVRVLEFVAVDTEAHAKRLKAALDEVLHGESNINDNDELRHQWCDVLGCFTDEFSRAMWWGIVLDQALRMVREKATSFRTYSANERDQKIQRSRQGGRIR